MTITLAVNKDQATLKTRWLKLKQEQPRLRIRNAAEELGVSELELVLTSLGEEAALLNSEFALILKELEGVGRVMALSRNDQAVHERHGVYTDFSVNNSGVMGICVGEIDLRVFFRNWHCALAVNEIAGESIRRSIQFFDIEGTAVHKVYATADTNIDAWSQLVNKHINPNQEDFLELKEKPKQEYPNAGECTREQVREPWSKLKDVHHFNALLKRLGIDRLEALHLVGDDYAKPLPIEAAEKTLELAAETGIEIMVFVGNGNIVQIHTGTVSKLLRTGPWFNVLDPDFNLHLNTEQLDSCWLVRRPTTDGTVTSVECFNSERELVLTLFGARKPGQDELVGWRKLTANLEESL